MRITYPYKVPAYLLNTLQDKSIVSWRGGIRNVASPDLQNSALCCVSCTHSHWHCLFLRKEQEVNLQKVLETHLKNTYDWLAEVPQFINVLNIFK